MTKFVGEKYWEERLQKSFGLHGVGFIGMGRCYNNWLYKIRRRVFLKRVQEFRGDFNISNALDIGCGSGFYIERWKELGLKSIVGIDITKIAVDEMRTQHPECKFYQMDISKDVKPISNMKFDYISAFDVLFHIVNDIEFESSIHNIHSLLKPGGLFLWSDNFLHDKTIRSNHQVCRSLANIEMILQNAGLQVLQRRPMFYLMNAPVDTRNRAIKILWKFLKSTISKSEFAGACLGGLLYPVELLFIAIANESPTTEIMICKKA